MLIFKIIPIISVYFVCEVSCYVCVERDRCHRSDNSKDDVYEIEPLCEQRPRHGICVPIVHCPAHVKPGSYNSACHKKGSNFVGVCCFTSSGHAVSFCPSASTCPSPSSRYRNIGGEFSNPISSSWGAVNIRIERLLLPDYSDGPDIMLMFDLAPSPGYSSSYDQLTNLSLTAKFSTAAMSLGHSTVDGKITTRNPNSDEVYETISIPEVMFRSRLRLRRFLDPVGLTWQPMQTVGPVMSEDLTTYLFHGSNPEIKVQRSRDYGVRSYNKYRRLCDLEPYLDFNQFPPSAMQHLASVYENPEDLDLWVGGLLEEPVESGIVGPTYAHIITDQFAGVKKGNTYFYEYAPDVNPRAMTPRVICDNRDDIELVSQPLEAFLRADLSGIGSVPCDSLLIPSMDLSKI